MTQDMFRVIGTGSVFDVPAGSHLSNCFAVNKLCMSVIALFIRPYRTGTVAKHYIARYPYFVLLEQWPPSLIIRNKTDLERDMRRGEFCSPCYEVEHTASSEFRYALKVVW